MLENIGGTSNLHEQKAKSGGAQKRQQEKERDLVKAEKRRALEKERAASRVDDAFFIHHCNFEVVDEKGFSYAFRHPTNLR
nr:hypothetical protein [uncultured Pseudomonas sp.]